MFNSLATQQSRSTSVSSSRTLCLILQPLNKTAETKLKPSLAEVFLRFSPRVQFRAPNYIFIDIGSTAHLFKGERALLDEVVALSKELSFKVQAAISDTPSGSNALACSSLAVSLAHQICHPGRERETLQHLSLPLLLHLEGLKAWAKPQIVEQIISFFRLLGLREIGDLKKFSYMSFRERWGETGAVLWRRIRVLEKQVVSPLEPTEVLQEYVFLDFPVGLLPLLLHQTTKAAEFLFARLQSRRLYAQKLVLNLRCEYSDLEHKIEIEPNKASRDLSLFMALLEHKLEKLDLLNPIRDFEVEIIPCPENSRQFDFFEPRTTAEERLDQLLSILKQAEIKAGLFEITPSLLPEKSFELSSLADQNDKSLAKAKTQLQQPLLASPSSVDVGEVAVDLHHRNLSTASALEFKREADDKKKRVSANETEISVSEFGHTQVQPLPAYSDKIFESPRPTRLLKKPRSLTSAEVSRLHLLSRNPLERIQLDWWDPPIKFENRFESVGAPNYRDYYFAINDEGQCLWIYKENSSEANVNANDQYFLHGYFD